MKKVSDKQAKKNRELKAIKKALDMECFICKRYGSDFAHILPKSIFPEHYTNPKNLVVLCRKCHNKFDNNLSFRQKQTKLFNRASEFDKLGAIRYFKLYED